jgi:hypothetical protein
MVEDDDGSLDAVLARLGGTNWCTTTVALAITAAVGDFARFASPDRLVSYIGLNLRVH